MAAEHLDSLHSPSPCCLRIGLADRSKGCIDLAIAVGLELLGTRIAGLDRLHFVDKAYWVADIPPYKAVDSQALGLDILAFDRNYFVGSQIVDWEGNWVVEQAV